MKYIYLFLLFTLPLFSKNLDLELNDLKTSCKSKTINIEHEGEDGVCSGQGLIISQDGYVLTAKHVIEDMIEETCYVFWIDAHNRPHNLRAALVSEHPDLDIALLKVSHPLGQDFPYFEFDSSHLQPGTWIFLSYFDADRIKYFLRGGKILHIETQEIRMSIRSCPGDSGSPCVLLNGKVIGVNVGSNYKANICVPFNAFDSWLYRYLP